MLKGKIIKFIKVLILAIVLLKCSSDHYIESRFERYCDDFNLDLKSDVRFESARLAYSEADYYLSLSIYGDILSESVKNDNRVKTVYSLINLAMVHAKTKDYKKAMATIDRASYKNSFIEGVKIRENLFFYALILETRGVIEQERKDYDLSISYLNKALGIYLSCRQAIRLINTYNYLGISYYYKGLHESSLEYFLNGLSLAGGASYFDNIGLTLFFIGRVYIAKGRYNRALEYLNAALSVDKRNKSYLNVSEDLYELGRLYFLQDNHKMAEHYYNRSLEVLVGVDNSKKSQEKWKFLMSRVTKKLKTLKASN